MSDNANNQFSNRTFQNNDRNFDQTHKYVPIASSTDHLFEKKNEELDLMAKFEKNPTTNADFSSSSNRITVTPIDVKDVLSSPSKVSSPLKWESKLNSSKRKLGKKKGRKKQKIEAVFQCYLCSKSFTYKHNLSRHVLFSLL